MELHMEKLHMEKLHISITKYFTSYVLLAQMSPVSSTGSEYA
jgi:hypothetical protein